MTGAPAAGHRLDLARRASSGPAPCCSRPCWSVLAAGRIGYRAGAGQLIAVSNSEPVQLGSVLEVARTPARIRAAPNALLSDPESG